MACHYRLQVIRAEGVHWKSSLRGREPSLYVEVKLGSPIRRTKIAKKCASPIWNEALFFAFSDESATFEVQVKYKSTLLSDSCVGAVDIKVVDLLAKSINDEEVAFSSPLIVLHLEVNGAMATAQNSISSAAEDIRSSKIQRLEGISFITQVASRQSDLYKAVGDLLSRLSMFKDVVDVVSEIHPFLTIAWKLASALHAGIDKAFQTDQKTLREKTASIYEPINGLLKQTIECCLFVRLYVRRSFFIRVLDNSSGQKVDDRELMMFHYSRD
ncbi:hypothetical protein ACEPAH_7423 [Sanghuangporus vaninii]